jgi:lipopolysaccharide biosynthesis regulator YciM
LDKQHRDDLKKDQFVETVGHSVEYVAGHRQQLYTYGGLALAAVAVALGVYWYTGNKHATEQAALAQALQIKQATIGVAAQPGDPRPSFPTEQDRNKALDKALNDVVTRHGGSDAASVALFQLGVSAADKGNMPEAAKYLEQAAQAGSREYVSSAKLTLAQTYQAMGKNAEAEKLLRELIASPSVIVSKEQAMFTLARLLAVTKPDEARKLIDPLQKDARPVIVRNAVALLGELPTK